MTELKKMIELVFEKNQATKTNKTKLFKLAKANKDMATIEKMIEKFDFKAAKQYIDKLKKRSNKNTDLSYHISGISDNNIDNSSVVDDTNIIITSPSPFHTTHIIQTENDFKHYQSELSKLSYSELYIELSNLMAAKHNIMFIPMHPNETVEVQGKIEELFKKAIAICIRIFGKEMIARYGDTNKLIDLINAIDNELSHEPLDAEQHGREMLNKVSFSLKKEDNWTPLLMASNAGDEKLVKKLLVDNSAVDDKLDDGTNALMLASSIGNDAIIKLLLKYNIDINHQKQIGHNALIVAIQNKNFETAKLLIKNSIDIHAFGWKMGDNPLFISYFVRNLELFKLLLEKGARVNHLMKGFNTILDVSLSEKEQEYIDLLLKYGAKQCHRIDKKTKELDLDDEIIVQDLFYKVDSVITSDFIAKQFILEELKAASTVLEEGHSVNKKFLENSGFSAQEYENAYDKSFPEIDDLGSPQDILNTWLLPYMLSIGLANPERLKVVEIRYNVVDLIMKKYGLGKYGKKVKIFITENEKSDKKSNFIIYDNYMEDNELNRYEKINEKKYYNQEYKMYLEYDNQYVKKYSMTYELNKKNDEYLYLITDKKEIYEHEVDSFRNNNVHNPALLANILKNFSNDTRLQYTNHTWDGNITYEDFMNNLKNAWGEIKNDLQALSPSLHAQIEEFLFSEKNEVIGFSTPFVVSELKSGKKPDEIVFDENTMQDKMNEFKAKIVVKQNDKELRLLKIITPLKKELKKELEKKLQLDIKLDDLKEGKIDKFFTDVDRLRSGLSIILKDIYENAEIDKREVIFQAEEIDNIVEMKIIHKNSKSLKTAQELSETIHNNGGNFKSIHENLTSVCDWSVDTICQDGNRYRIDYLYPEVDNNKPHLQKIDETIEGFTHILRFYK